MGTRTDKRHLSAVMFTDMVGYTALMQEDEEKARSHRDRHREIMERRIKEFQGTILQYFGDGTMTAFDSAFQAVTCAMEIQLELQKEPKIPVRIGLHVGDVVYEEDGVYGDAVNVASRIENISVPGSVLFSHKVYDDIKNHPQLTCRSVGTFKFKNVIQPIEVYSLTHPALTVPNATELKGKVKNSIGSLAVLPFVNMSGDPENEYFSDGMSEELINAITKLEDLAVTARTSSFAFKGKKMDIREIGAQLNVDTILEGSVRKAGNRVRVTAQLVNVADGYHLFSESYDRNLEDIFEVQDDIAGKITEKLLKKLGGTSTPEKKHLVKSPAKNIEAYNLYLKGMFFWKKWSTKNIYKAVELFEEAIRLEPDFAQAWSWIANSYSVLGLRGSLLPAVAYPKAQHYAHKALELDDEISQSHLSLAVVKIFYEWDCEGAFQAIERAMELNPGSGSVYHIYAMYLQTGDQMEKALQAMEKAVSLNPLSESFHNHFANIYFLDRQYDQALMQLEKAFEINPDNLPVIELKGWILFMKGETQAAIETYKRFEKITGSLGRVCGALGYAYARTGQINEAMQCMESLRKRQKMETQEMLDMDFLMLNVGLGNLDQAFIHLEKIVEARLGAILYMRKHPGLEDLRNDPRYDKLMKRIGLESKCGSSVGSHPLGLLGTYK